MKKFALVAVVALAVILYIDFHSGSGPKQAISNPGSVADIAKKIAARVGTVESSFLEGTKGPIYVFEEFHTSRVGQIETAIMLLRLREQYGVKKVGLEGSIQAARAL